MMEATQSTYLVAIAGLLIIGLLMIFQLIALLKPDSEWVKKSVYGGSFENSDPKACFAFYRGFALADVFTWGPLQVIGSIGMLMGEHWGFLIALVGSVPFWYSSIPFFIWDREMGFRKKGFNYWFFTWGMFPLFGVVETLYCLVRLLNL